MRFRTLERDSAYESHFYAHFILLPFSVTCIFRTLCCYGIIRGMMFCKTIERGSALRDPFLDTVHITASMTCIYRTLCFRGIIRVTMCRRTSGRDSALRNPFLGTNYITASFYNVHIPYNVFLMRIFQQLKNPETQHCEQNMR
jgi:hypothetical protein